MKSFLKITLITTIILFLTGCKYSNPYLVRHPNTFKSVLTTCQAMGDQAQNDPQCQSGIVLYQQVGQLSRELVVNPARFGQGILKNQMTLGKLKEQIDKILAKNGQNLVKSDELELKKLQAQYDGLQELIEIKRGIINQLEPM